MYVDAVESLPDIKLSEQLGTSNSGQGFINQRQWILVLLCEEVELPEVNIETEGPVWLLSKEDWRHK